MCQETPWKTEEALRTWNTEIKKMMPGIINPPTKPFDRNTVYVTDFVTRFRKYVLQNCLFPADMSFSSPGTIGARRNQERGQIECYLAIDEAFKTHLYDSKTKDLDEAVLAGESLHATGNPFVMGQGEEKQACDADLLCEWISTIMKFDDGVFRLGTESGSYSYINKWNDERSNLLHKMWLNTSS